MDALVAGSEATLLRETQEVIADLPEDDAVAASRQISEALRAINGSDALTLEERYDDICLLEAVTVAQTRKLLDEYLHTSRHMKQRESELWNSAYQCWRELALAYTSCAQRYAGDASAAAGFQKLARVSTARAMCATRRQLQWLRIRYARPTPLIWVGLAELYRQVEAQYGDTPLTIHPGVTTTFKQELLKALMLAVLPSDHLKPLEQDLATGLVGRFAASFVMSVQPVDGCTHSFDLAEPRMPQPLSESVGASPTLRFFGPGAAGVRAQEALGKLEATGEIVPMLGVEGAIAPTFLRPVLTHIATQWSGETHERRSERQTANTRVTVVPGMNGIFDLLEQTQADPFNFADRPDGESWLAHDVSPDGFGVVMPAVVGDWITVGSVAAIEGETAGEWAVGMVRRMRRLEDGQQHIGVEVLSRLPQAMRVMREMRDEVSVRITQRLPVDRAILLTADVLQQKEIEVLASDVAPYREGRLHALIEDSVLLVSLAREIETTDFCSRIVLTVHGVDA